MNGSVIIGFFISLFSKIMIWFENSAFFKMQKYVSAFWSKISKKSCIVNVFMTYPKTDEAVRGSVLYRMMSGILSFFRKIFQRGFEFCSDTVVFSSVKAWYTNFFTRSVRGYCLAVFAMSLCYSVPGALRFGMTRTYTALFVAAAVAAAGIAVDKSLCSMFSNSVVFKFLSKLFECNVSGCETCEKCSASFLTVHLLLGALSGALSAYLGNLYVPLIMCALLGMGALAVDYRIGAFAALIFMPFLPTMAVVGFVLVSFVFFLLKLLCDKNFKFRHTPLDAPLGVFTLIMFISAVTSFARGNSINIFLVYFAFVLSYWLTVNAVRTRGQLYGLICAMLFAGVGVALYGIYQHVFGFAEGTTWTDTEMFENIATRVVSTFGNPNVLGEYLLLLIPVCAGYVFARPSSFNRSVSLVCAALLSLCMVYTYSRGNWIGLMVAVLLFFMFYDGRIVWLGLVAMLFAPLFLPQTVIDRFMSVGNTSDTSTSYRVYIWMGTISMLRDYWLSGIGLGTEAFNVIYPFYSYSGIVAPHSHNLYLQIITENGIMGIIAFLALIVVYYRMCISAIIREKKDRMLKATIIGLAAGMFGYLVQGMFDNVWYNYRIVFMFYIILALTSCGILLSKKREASND